MLFILAMWLGTAGGRGVGTTGEVNLAKFDHCVIFIKVSTPPPPHPPSLTTWSGLGSKTRNRYHISSRVGDTFAWREVWMKCSAIRLKQWRR